MGWRTFSYRNRTLDKVREQLQIPPNDETNVWARYKARHAGKRGKPYEISLMCGGKLHTIRIYDRGPIILLDHTGRANMIADALKDSKDSKDCLCKAIFKEWKAESYCRVLIDKKDKLRAVRDHFTNLGSFRKRLAYTEDWLQDKLLLRIQKYLEWNHARLTQKVTQHLYKSTSDRIAPLRRQMPNENYAAWYNRAKEYEHIAAQGIPKKLNKFALEVVLAGVRVKPARKVHS